MKLLICGDTHFGVKDGSNNAFTYQKHFYDDIMIPLCLKENIDGVIFLGDIFHNRRTVNMFILANVIQLFNTIKSAIPSKLYGIEGNHDLYFRNSYDVAAVRDISLGGLYYGEKENASEYYTLDSGKCLLVHWKNSKDEYIELFERIKKEINTSKVEYIFGHFAIQGAAMVGKKLDSSATDLNAEDFAVYFPNHKKVISGHFHTPSEFGNIKYIGVPYHLTWNDANNTLGTYILDTDSGELQFYENPKKMFIYVKIENIDVNIDEFIEKLPKLDYKMTFKVVFNGKEFEDVAKTMYNEILNAGHDALLLDESIYKIDDIDDSDVPDNDTKSLEELIEIYFKNSKLIPKGEWQDYYDLFKSFYEETKSTNDNLEFE